MAYRGIPASTGHILCIGIYMIMLWHTGASLPATVFCRILLSQITEKADMPRKRIQKPCACRCGAITAGGYFLPGHDTKTLSAIVAAVGGIVALRNLIERILDKDVEVVLD